MTNQRELALSVLTERGCLILDAAPQELSDKLVDKYLETNHRESFNTLKKLFWANFVMLFAETMAIRWLGMGIPVLSLSQLDLNVGLYPDLGVINLAKRVGKVKVIASLLCLISSVLYFLLVYNDTIFQHH